MPLWNYPTRQPSEEESYVNPQKMWRVF